MQKTFEDRSDEICAYIDKRRHKWKLASLDWDDARQIILIRIFKKYHLYDPEKSAFGHWVNRLISNEIKNIWRNHYTSWSRPCIQKCPFNAGSDSCTKTPSGKQSAECPLYAEWQKRKEGQHNIMQTLSMEHHTLETHSKPDDSIDIEAKKKIIDVEMRKKLSANEWKAYRLLIIKGLPEKEVAKALGFKAPRGKIIKMYSGYLQVLGYKHLFVEKAKEIIEEEGLAA